MKPSRVSRVLQIVIALQSGQNVQVDDLAKMNNLSRRTIFRDLKALKETGIPYSYDAKAGAYSIDPSFFLPPANLNREEATGLLLLAHKLRNYITMPFKKATLLATMKLENNLPVKIRHYCNDALRNIFIRPGPQAKSDSLDKIFAQLLEAILKKRIVSIHYYLPREHNGVLIDLSPYHLMYNNLTWYVVGRSSIDKKVHPFKLSRIRQLSRLDKCFTDEEKFDIGDYLSRAWSMVPEGRLYHVKLKFLLEVAYDVAEVEWHSTQKVTFQDDGSAIVEFRVDGLNEIIWWILSYGDRVEVLAPRILRLKVIEIARKVIKSTPQ